MFRRRSGVRVRQRIRKFELWPVFKFAIAFHAICGAISLGVLTLFWQVGANAGFTDKVINFLVDIGFAESVRISGSRLFRGASTISAGLVLHNTVVTVLLAALYNLLSGLLGGLIISVVEDDQIRPVGRRSTSALAQDRTVNPNPSGSKNRRRERRRGVGRSDSSDATTLLPRRPSTPAGVVQPESKGSASASSRTFAVTPSDGADGVDGVDDADGADDTDWLAALADDTFDDELDEVIDRPYQRHLGGQGIDQQP